MWINFLNKHVTNNPHKTALVDQKTNRRMSYLELDTEVRKLAQFLRTEGVGHGDRVSYLSTNRSYHLTLFLACAHLGAIFVPLNFRLASGELEAISKRIEAKINFYHNEMSYTASGKTFDLDNLDLDSMVRLEHSCCTGAKDPLLMLFTSGSTGEPKGVLLHGEMLAANQVETVKGWGLRDSDISIVETPFFHTGGHNVLCLPLLLIGGTVVIAEKFDAANFYKTLKTESISVYFGVPTMFQILAENESFNVENLSSLRFLVSGGASIPVELIGKYQKLGLMFKQGFGLTEVGPNCFLLDESKALEKAGSIGRPMPHSEVLILKEDGLPAGVGEVGELLLAGPHVCAGYFREPERFKEALFDHYFKTGDLVTYDKDNFFFVVGRKKDMYISGGENVYPAEVEKQIIAHPDIADCVVVAVSDERWGEVGLAYIRPKVGGANGLKLAELKEFLSGKLSRYKQPHYVEILNSFPLLASGKIDRKALSFEAREKYGERL